MSSTEAREYRRKYVAPVIVLKHEILGVLQKISEVQNLESNPELMRARKYPHSSTLSTVVVQNLEILHSSNTASTRNIYLLLQ